MKNNKKIIFNQQEFILPEKPIADPGATGTVYRLQTDTDDLAVKMYHTKPLLPTDEIIFPTRDELEYFIDFAPETVPILLSKYLIEDKFHHYCGCAADYIVETRGTTAEAIFYLPKELVFGYLKQLWKAIPTLNEWAIAADDWSLSNIKLGRGKNLPEAIYLFDDSNYEIKKYQTDNISEANLLVERMVEHYCVSKFDEEISWRILNNYLYKGDTLNYLEHQCKKSPTIGHALDSQAKVLQRTYF